MYVRRRFTVDMIEDAGKSKYVLVASCLCVAFRLYNFIFLFLSVLVSLFFHFFFPPPILLLH